MWCGVPRALPRPAPTDVFREGLRAGDYRMRLAVMLAAYAGLRRSEIVSLRLTDVTDVELRVVEKGGHERRIPLHPDLRGAIVAWRAKCEQEPDGGEEGGCSLRPR